MKILTIGCGYIGSVLARHLSERIPLAEIVISDESKEAVEKAASSIGRENVKPLQLNIRDYDRLVKMAENFDILVGLAPGKLGYKTVEAAIEAGVDMVDLSYMPEDPMTLNDKALKAGVTIIPDCGLAPGLSHILVGRTVSMLDEVKNVVIFVGGIPQRRIPPLDYKVTWCVEDLIEEYVRKPKVVKNGKTVEVEALDGLEEIEFPGVGKLEAFYTDGVRTLHHSIKCVENMWEKTLRYPGHAEKIRLLRDLGFFNEEPIDGISPRSLTIKVFERKLSVPNIKDLVAMKVEVDGIKNSQETCYSYFLLDYYDEKKKVTAMGRTTAYTASAVIQLLAKKEIGEIGIIPPERLGMNEKYFGRIIKELEKDGIRIKQLST
ncbi:saccharopine dehydrogenase family protein [Candidatus Bathyarchaeota archaeon]|nr:saccharopine dehydrogenase family protein [Candidatus Bathyarchaeota archaeon]MBS7613056.1 saccharopine dehydrogenase family protein [Candidatus Bathyarchaeota archaeon]MBS7617297.1 saccharopine dehydrogenase family protein [Candidatus Bathyarchaeota archaeon]